MPSISSNHNSKSTLAQNKYLPAVNKTSADISARTKEYAVHGITKSEEKNIDDRTKSSFFNKANTLKFGSHSSIINKLGTYSAQELYSKQSSGMDLEEVQSREDYVSTKDEIENKANCAEKTAFECTDIKNEYKPKVSTPTCKTNEDFIEFLKNKTVKDAQGNEYLRFSDDEIQILTNINTQEVREAIQFLVELKNGDEPRFDGYDINTLIDKAITQEGRDAIEYLAGFKNGDNPRFELYNICELAESAQTQKGRDAIEYIAGFKDGDKPRFDGFYFDESLVNIAKTQEGRNAIEYLAGFKNNDKPRFDGDDISYLADKTKNPKDRDAIEYLAGFKYSNNTIFRGDDISRLVYKVQSKEGKDTIEYLARFKDGDNLLFSGDNIAILFDKAKTKEGRETIEYLAGFKKGNHLLFNGDNISSLVYKVQTKEGRGTIEYLARLKENDTCGFIGFGIGDLVEPAKTQEGRDIIEYLLSAKDNNKLSSFEIIDIASLAKSIKNKKDKEFIYKLVDENINMKNDNILNLIDGDNIEIAEQLVKQVAEKEITPEQCLLLLENYRTISYKDIQKLRQTIGRDRVDNMDETDLFVTAQFSSLNEKQNINEISIEEKRGLLRNLVKYNTGLSQISDDLANDFPLIPRNQDQYCTLLFALIRSLGGDVTPLKPETKVANFNNSMSNLSHSLAKVSDTDFANITITQEYSKDDFIKTVLSKVKDLSREERQKVYDYYGFELHHNKGNKSTGFSITGYPVNLNNGKKLAQITDPKTKEVVENLRQDVIRFTQNNRIKSNNPQVEQFLNEIIDALPELRTTIGKTQHSTHDFDIMKHSLKVMQKISQDPKFNELNDSDKKIMMLASLMHDIRKREGYSDPTHADESSFDTLFIAKKFSLSKDEEIKLYTLIKHHEWLQYVNTARDKDGNIIPEILEKRLQSVAYDLQQDNLFDMAIMFTHADLKAVKSDNTFHDMTMGKGRVDEAGKPISYGGLADNYAQRIKKYVTELQKSQPLLPVTKIPTSSVMKQAITQVNPDGSTNLKGVYLDNDGLVVLKYNEVEDWEALGFPKDSVSKGISAKGLNNNGQETDVDTGNIKFFVHGLDYANQLAKFDAFGLVGSDVLLSVSYAERPESKYRFFRTQGVLLDVDTKYVHGGGNTDSGSGCGKSIADFKKDYIFGGERESDRLYISNMIKEATGMNDDEYVRFVKENENKPFTEIEPADVREKIIKAFATINSNVRKGNREYNEMYASNPNVMGVFAYSSSDNVGNVLEFVENNLSRLDFLKQFAIERDIPMIVFGD